MTALSGSHCALGGRNSVQTRLRRAHLRCLTRCFALDFVLLRRLNCLNMFTSLGDLGQACRFIDSLGRILEELIIVSRIWPPIYLSLKFLLHLIGVLDSLGLGNLTHLGERGLQSYPGSLIVDIGRRAEEMWKVVSNIDRCRIIWLHSIVNSS